MKKLLAPLFFGFLAACNPSRNIPESYRAHECTIQVSEDTVRALLDQGRTLQLNDSTNSLRVLQYNTEKERVDTFPHSTYLACSLNPQRLPSCATVDSLIEQHKEILQKNNKVSLVRAYTGEVIVDLFAEKPIGVLGVEKGRGKSRHTAYVSYYQPNNSFPITSPIEEKVHTLTTSTLDTRDGLFQLRSEITQRPQTPSELVIIPENPNNPCSVYRAQTATQENVYQYYEEKKKAYIAAAQEAHETLQKYPQVFVTAMGCPDAMKQQFDGKLYFFDTTMKEGISATEDVSYTKTEFENPCDLEANNENCITLQKAGSTITITSNCKDSEFNYYVYTMAGTTKCHGTTSTSIDLTQCDLGTSPTIYSILVYNNQGKNTIQISYP